MREESIEQGDENDWNHRMNPTSNTAGTSGLFSLLSTSTVRRGSPAACSFGSPRR